MTAPETPAVAASGDIPFVTDALRLVRVLFAPTEVFEENREKPAFWIPWIIVTVLILAFTMLSFPFTMAAMRLGAEARGQPLPASMESIARFSSLVAVPVMMLIMCLVAAGLMYLVLLASGGTMRYKGLLSVTILGGLIGVLQVLLTYVVLKMRGPDGLQTLADYQVSFGLDLLLPQDTALPDRLVSMLRAVTPFSIWSLILTAIGVRVTEKTSSGAAWAASVAAFLLGVVMAAVFGGMGGGPR